MSGYGRSNQVLGQFNRKVYALYTADEYNTLKADLTRIKTNIPALRADAEASLYWLDLGHALLARIYAGDYSDAIRNNPERRPRLGAPVEGGSMLEEPEQRLAMTDVLVAGERATGETSNAGNIIRTVGVKRSLKAKLDAGSKLTPKQARLATELVTKADPGKLVFKPAFGKDRVSTGAVGPEVEYNTAELRLFTADLNSAIQTLLFWAKPATAKWKSSTAGAEKARTALLLLTQTINGEKPFKVLDARPQNIALAQWSNFVKVVTEKAPPVVEDARSTGLTLTTGTPPEGPEEEVDEELDDDYVWDGEYFEEEPEPTPPANDDMRSGLRERSLFGRIQEHAREHPIAYGAGAVVVAGLGWNWWRNR